ncbi:MAG: carboxymuconolactone decarboxylase family protein [Lautropia sp.]
MTSTEPNPPPDAHEPPITRTLSPEGMAALDAVRARRGYTLPYHRLFAAHAPALLSGYDAFYDALTLAPRVLSPAERETVWACLLAAAREVHGFIHLKRARAAGLDEATLGAAVAIAAVTESFPVLAFSGEHWAHWTEPGLLERRYRALFAAASEGVDPALAHLAAVAAMGAHRHAAGLSLHLRAAFDAGARADQVCEALSYLLIPCGGNALIDAVAVWEDGAANGTLPAPY